MTISPLSAGGDSPPARKSGRKYLIVQGVLCGACTLIGALYPTLLDWAKTGFEQEVSLGPGGALDTQERRAYPFSPFSVVLVNDAVQLSIAIVAVLLKEGRKAFCGLESGLVVSMMPLGAVYAFGEILTLRSVQKGSGPVYVVIANMKLVIAALISRAFFGRAWSMPCRNWCQLCMISLAAAAYTLAEAGALGSQWRWEGAGMAVLKSSLVSFTSVFCEHIYKKNKFYLVLTLQAFWGFMFMVVLCGASVLGFGSDRVAAELTGESGAFTVFGSGPAAALCDSVEHSMCIEDLKTLGAAAGAATCTCISSRGWDVYTLGAILADLSNAISSALVFKRLSAVAKYVCRALSAVPMYLFYCGVGRSDWDLRVFAIIVFLCAQVSLYTVQRHRDQEAQANAEWAAAYGTPTTPEKEA